MTGPRLEQDPATESRGVRVCPCPDGTRYAGSVPDREPTRPKVEPSVVLAAGFAPTRTVCNPLPGSAGFRSSQKGFWSRFCRVLCICDKLSFHRHFK